ncbi:MAG: MBL fold metallo-hydrolase [Lachnospiraceae bacterium]|nr:MBL fold metallo-hydrolase [Lachnospiraceae bacterium]
MSNNSNIDIRIKKMPVGYMMTNCYIVFNDTTKEAIIVDPGFDAERIFKFVSDNSLKPVGIFLTHGHFDHIGCVTEVKVKYNAKIYLPELERETFTDINMNYTLQELGKSVIVKGDVYLNDDDIVEILGTKIKALSTPGHTAGGMCFYIEEAGVLLAGDTLFYGSVGRTDFAGGSMSKLVRSVKEKLFVLPDNTLVLPGHGENTDIGFEKVNNPFLI